MKGGSNTGMTLLGVWLILFGALPLLNIDFELRPLILNGLAVAAGVTILMKK